MPEVNIHVDGRFQSRETNLVTLCERSLLCWSAYILKNKHTHTLFFWPNLGCRSFRQPHTHSWRTQWSCVIPLKHSANWGIETSLGGRDYGPWSLLCFQIAHPAAPQFTTENEAHNNGLSKSWPKYVTGSIISISRMIRKCMLGSFP